MTNPERIALIGPRGSGKSSVGLALARLLGWTFLDADAELEARAGLSIRAIFETEGEPGFRRRESAILADLCRLPWHVLATGGGVILRPENRDLLRNTAWVVWLTADVETLSRRLGQDALSRERSHPDNGRFRDFTEEIAAVLRTREPLYRECAHLVVDTSKEGPEEIAGLLRERMKASGGRQPPVEDRYSTGG